MGSGIAPLCVHTLQRPGTGLMTEGPAQMHNMNRPSATGIAAPPLASRRLAARSCWGRHALVCTCIASAMLVLMRWWAWAWAPASIIAIIYLMYASIEMTEARARALRDAWRSAPRPRTRAALVARERIGATILATLAIGFLAMAVIVAALVLDSQMLGVGTAVVFCAVVFVGLPAWAAAVGDSLPE
jgi:hypothetical protein